jgi:hypothetical protein
MEIISKECTSKTKNEATVVITLPKAAFLSHSSTPFLPKSPKSLFPMGLFTWASKETAVARAVARPLTSTAVLMTGNGKKIKNTEWGNSNISTRQNITDNGKMTLGKAMERTTILMATVTRGIGTGTCKTGLELITTQMAIFTRGNG